MAEKPNLHVVPSSTPVYPFESHTWGSTTTTTLSENSPANPVPSVQGAVDQYHRTVLDAHHRIAQAVRDAEQAIATAIEGIERALLEVDIAGIELDGDLEAAAEEIVEAGMEGLFE